MDNHTIYAASVRQLNGLIAERDALVAALAAKQQQVDGLLEERQELRHLLAAAHVRETPSISMQATKTE